ncbi:RING-type E3 ubiquitin transferase [Heracleum sosnowskyi]|uniref:RING-type E3 ubiquitin transferase n=1 Tax=Heracleum sosnowskyi TaxID=360622 RepID=A0AAD8M1I5_9APIA|nr:RING-type E3 ubiquitin transferase [Heracleum sosnowskyi]
MAMSLEDLLAKEGFKSRKLKSISRTSTSSEPSSRPLYSNYDQNKSGLSPGATRVRRTEKTKSDIPQLQSDKFKDIRAIPRDDLFRREVLDGNLKKEAMLKLKRKNSLEFRGSKSFGIRSSAVLPDNEIVDADLDNCRFETGSQHDERYADVYSNEVYSPSGSTGKVSSGSGGIATVRNMSAKNLQEYKRRGNNSNQNLLGHVSSRLNNRKSMKQTDASNYRPSGGSQNNKSFDESKHRRQPEIEDAPAEPALDEIAVRAMISILTGYIKRFFIDGDFKASLRHNCFASLNFVGLEEGIDTESKVIDNLEQAIETVERAAEESATATELKKASLHLSVITGLNANDLKDGYTSGIPNSKLSACAHLYLSVIYKLQKKDRIAAKHLLQVFCDSPFPARTSLLPELWNDIFLPHLSHIKAWYNDEADSLADSPSKEIKLKILEKVYNEIMDSGTYQFAAYYKDWLTEGVEAPTIPSIRIPSASIQGVDGEVLNSNYSDPGNPLIPFSSQPMLSLKLNHSDLGSFSKSGADQVVDFEEAENFDISRRSSTASVVEDKETLTYSSNAAVLKELVIKQEAVHHEDGLTACHKAGSGEINFIDKFDDAYQLQHRENVDKLLELSYTKVNELTLRKLAKAVFGFPQSEECLNDINSSLLPDKDAHYIKPLANRPKLFHQCWSENSDYFVQWSSLLSIPEDFICPLSGLCFEEPVTLETGQTFETEALRQWFDKGHKTCPISGVTLEYQAVPLTNFILKRVVDTWKFEHCRTLLGFAGQLTGNVGDKIKDEAAVSIFDHLLTFSSRDERIRNVKLLISLGGLQFFIRRFESGNLEEKTIIAALLSHCIEADSGCRNHIARDIEKMCFVELLHCKQAKSIANAVSLLIELICLNRRIDVCSFLSGLENKEMVHTMHVLLIYLQSCPSDQRPSVAVLLLHLDLLIAPKKYSIYREEAVDAIAVALESSLTDDKIRDKCCNALLVLGGRFSLSGKVMIEDWILKKAGFIDCHEPELLDSKEDILPANCTLSDTDEDDANEEWLRILSASLLDGRKSFLETISLCLGSGQLDLVRTCLTTVAWLSSSITSLPDFRRSAFLPLISRLKGFLENSERVEHKVLASMSLLNFSRIPECRIQLLASAQELEFSLQGLAEVTWTAEKLYTTLFSERSLV